MTRRPLRHLTQDHAIPRPSPRVEPTDAEVTAMRRAAAILLVTKRRDNSIHGSGTWQTWDWILELLEAQR